MSAKKTLGRDAWKRIRRDILEAAHNSCEICGDEPSPYYGDPLNCHEVWHYNDASGIVTLVNLRAQCTKCDSAVHIGRAVERGYGETAFAQLQKVNRITRTEAQRLYAAALTEWQRRSRQTWRIRVAQSLLNKYPALARLTEDERVVHNRH